MAKNKVEENNYWPVFVDALSTIVLVVTFLVIILGLAIYEISKKYEETIRSEVIAELKVKPHVAQGGYELPSELGYKDLGENTGKGFSEVKDPEGNIVDARFKENQAERTYTRIIPSDALITIGYGPDAVDMDAEAMAVATTILQSIDDFNNGSFDVIANSYSEVGSISEARRTAYYRVLGVRNYLIKMGVEPAKINFRVIYDPEQDVDDSKPIVQVYFEE